MAGVHFSGGKSQKPLKDVPISEHINFEARGAGGHVPSRASKGVHSFREMMGLGAPASGSEVDDGSLAFATSSKPLEYDKRSKSLDGGLPLPSFAEAKEDPSNLNHLFPELGPKAPTVSGGMGS